MIPRQWRPARDPKAERIPAQAGRARLDGVRRVVVIGGGIAGIAAATALAERGVEVVVLEREQQLGGRVRSWPVQHDGEQVTMSRGFHAFFRQYYNLRALLRRADPGLRRLRPVTDYPLRSAAGQADSFARLPRTPPWSIAGFVATSPSFRVRDLARVNVGQALALMDVDFPQTFADYDGVSAAQFLDRLRFPGRARHLALEVFARSFFADPREFSAGELVAMFHTYFVGSAEGLLFDVPDDDYNSSLWSPLTDRLTAMGVEVRSSITVTGIDLNSGRVAITGVPATGQPPTSRQQGRCGERFDADAVVLAADASGLRSLAADGLTGMEQSWRGRIGRVRSAPPFAVWRLWLDRPVAVDRPLFLGTSGYGPLDNISVVDRFERGAARWAARHGGSVVELHAYALAESVDDRESAAIRSRLWSEAGRVWPELAAARIVADEWLVNQDCVLVGTERWADRPSVRTPDPRLVLAGDTVRTDLPVALMERAATTGFQAANALLAGWGVQGHDLWTVPRRSRFAWPGRIRRRIDKQAR